MSLLFSPLQIRNTTFKNRIVVSPMCMYSSVDGFANDFHLVHLGSRAVGGSALVIQEATAVSPEGRISYGDMGLWNDEHMRKPREIIDFVHAQNGLIGIQLAHAGRKASYQLPQEGAKKIAPEDKNGWQTVSSSALPFREGEPIPLALDVIGIEKVKNDYIASTRRAESAGYDVVEIHAAHGYLFHQFYSPLANNRTDKYGGSFENRIRLLLEVTELVRKEWPAEKPLFVRISATDWTEGGWTIEDSVKLATELKKLGVDLIDTSSGGNVPKATIPSEPGYQADFAAQIKKEANILTGAVGQINTAIQAESLLKQGKADLILFGRESLRNPYLPMLAAKELDIDFVWPIQYQRAKL
ncbi:NADH:flavin oxidoreductase [Aequorivita sublithincola DSM 14238]|uniref:NADH:flavin oxidoreductase n=1 Tax=Aequorivita sublithincola (strain DSM 14238 / LMG 21431 / ACAM 643 / 9-3) TaxID=746697 RepID=I3YTE4_AEQSU|nr:NADH:flavin oxidoreductase/NADH oxidase [Aequorivita sublithincola]AFL80262.1 NADH:flavin oxidoreductase [Aequorivita sublithincola DSM 14238]